MSAGPDRLKLGLLDGGGRKLGLRRDLDHAGDWLLTQQSRSGSAVLVGVVEPAVAIALCFADLVLIVAYLGVELDRFVKIVVPQHLLVPRGHFETVPPEELAYCRTGVGYRVIPAQRAKSARES